ncbi:hypothetical protein [Niabella ginsenosidivorans]|uniref:hypothetical protein n=1 Tax=Niabella ginsenosidivorans TaxID=1176587 RepID=UPI0012EE4720|nr:hypothetical protein [Niabella ginsenosidivorans]
MNFTIVLRPAVPNLRNADFRHWRKRRWRIISTIPCLAGRHDFRGSIYRMYLSFGASWKYEEMKTRIMYEDFLRRNHREATDSTGSE